MVHGRDACKAESLRLVLRGHRYSVEIDLYRQHSPSEVVELMIQALCQNGDNDNTVA